MEALRHIIKSTNKSLIIDLPEEYSNKELEVIIFPLIDDKKEAQQKKKYDFSQFVGKLKWQGNALEEQKKLRNEW
jgi:hypothetical protein